MAAADLFTLIGSIADVFNISFSVAILVILLWFWRKTSHVGLDFLLARTILLKKVTMRSLRIIVAGVVVLLSGLFIEAYDYHFGGVPPETFEVILIFALGLMFAGLVSSTALLRLRTQS